MFYCFNPSFNCTNNVEDSEDSLKSRRTTVVYVEELKKRVFSGTDDIGSFTVSPTVNATLYINSKGVFCTFFCKA